MEYSILVLVAIFLSLHGAEAWLQQGPKLVGSGYLGTYVMQGIAASFSSDGNTLAVGGYQDNGDLGATWIFIRNTTSGLWTQQGSKLVGTGSLSTDVQQGLSVSLSSDGNTLAVGGQGDNSNLGATWIFSRNTTTGEWTQQGSKLVGSGSVGTTVYQGSGVSLSSDGNTLAVGASGDNNMIGATWIFTRSGGVWTQQGSKLVGTGGAGQSIQGFLVSMSSDGNTLAVSGRNDNSNVGAVWIFTRNTTSGVWIQQGSKLVGNGYVGQCYQGDSISLSSDGNTLAVSGSNDNSNLGAVWIFTRNATNGMWTQQGSKLVGSGSVGNPNQGSGVSLSSDGNVLAVGGAGDNSHLGATWIFTRNSSGVWTQQGSKLVGSGSVGVPYQGVGVSLSSDGTTLAVGGWFDNSDVGATWIFVNGFTDPVDQAALIAVWNGLTEKGSLGWNTSAPLCANEDIGCDANGKKEDQIIFHGRDLSSRSLTGVISTEIGLLTSLVNFTAQSNQLSGTIPTEMGQLTMLTVLELNNNNLTGTIPTQLHLTSLTPGTLSLANNSLCYNVNYTSWAATNDDFSVTFCSAGNCPNNYGPSCNGSCTCESGTCNSGFAGNGTCTCLSGWTGDNCDTCQPAHYGPNCLPCPCAAAEMCSSGTSGTGQCSNVDQLALTAFYNGLTIKPNWTTTISLCDQQGVTCNNARVVNLTLSGLGLTGTIATELGQLTQLTYLSLASNNLNGFIPSQLRISGLNVLELANNPLCYSVNYGSWATTTTDYSTGMQLCLGCGALCLNGGLCQSGLLSFSCACPTGYSGQSCETLTSCNPGSTFSNGVCVTCNPGTFSPTGNSCVPCQKGTASNITGASTACPPCTSGSYAAASGQTNCSACTSCKVGYFVQQAFTPSPSPANQTTVNGPETSSSSSTSGVSGWIFIGILLGFVILSTALLVPLRKRIRNYVSVVSVILRTPFSFLRVVPSSWTIVEIPSFFRGLVGLWVIVGIVLITAYQSEVFVESGVSTLQAMLPGSRFSSGLFTSSATTNVSLAITLYQTPIACDPTQFSLQVVAANSLSSGALSGIPVCTEDLLQPSITLTYSFPALLSFTTTSTISLAATSLSGSPLFSHGVSYKILLENYDGSFTQVTETLTNDPDTELTGDVTVSLSAVPTEYVDESGKTLETGYTFSYFSSSAPPVPVPSSAALQVMFNLPVPGSYYQIKDVQSITALQFVVGLVSLAGGVLTVGTLIGNAGSYIYQRFRANQGVSKFETPMSEVF